MDANIASGSGGRFGRGNSPGGDGATVFAPSPCPALRRDSFDYLTTEARGGTTELGMGGARLRRGDRSAEACVRRVAISSGASGKGPMRTVARRVEGAREAESSLHTCLLACLLCGWDLYPDFGAQDENRRKPAESCRCRSRGPGSGKSSVPGAEWGLRPSAVVYTPVSRALASTDEPVVGNLPLALFVFRVIRARVGACVFEMPMCDSNLFLASASISLGLEHYA